MIKLRSKYPFRWQLWLTWRGLMVWGWRPGLFRALIWKPYRD